MHRIIGITILCALVTGLLLTACSDSGSDDEIDTAGLQPIVDAWAERYQASAVAVSIESPSGATAFVGSTTRDETLDDRSPFAIGSQTKTMVTATALLLAEDGVLGIDEPIDRWLPEFPRADEITLRHLLSHSAGLAVPPVDPSLEALVQQQTPAERLAEAASLVGDQDLPARYAYSNESYHVAGAVIEAATGEPLADVLRDRILDPLDMENTYLLSAEPVGDPFVPGQLALEDGLVVPMDRDDSTAIIATWWASGGVVSTAGDMTMFWSDLLGDLLGPASASEMTTEVFDTGEGLGLVPYQWTGEVSGWGHTGGGASGHTSVGGVTDGGWTVVVLSNIFDVPSLGYGVDVTGLISEMLAEVTTAE